ncbi:hypothetical protein [Halalkalibacter alkaliphilus]|uniref:Swt1-like HEPN domain-containing protein n=1 Tax=Halalkalibacter alkaliphilus TaxID=2917993 RepID=A0A9X2CUX7_9BACI|nr:hypothetical protein [Halalkalibacter alkaliphilus]MCL7748738.1 hypothetical protein [Halalkalibacter alkaliphilus]
MGVPLSNYTVLKYLADGTEKQNANRKSIEMELALDALRNYSVFAFIIHDPTVHKDFHELFERQFKSLHNSSGEHLVFFGLVDSPSNYRLVGRKPYYQDVRDMVDLYENEKQDELDPSYTAFAIANSLNIQPEMLPAIVVTQDTRLQTYRWYKTCPDKIETQMSRLTGISYEMNYYKENEQLPLEEKQNILYQLLDEQDIDLCKGMGTTKLNKTMARTLSDLLSFLIDQEKYSSDNQHIQKMARKQQELAIRNIELSLTHLKSTLNDVDIDDIEEHTLYPYIEKLNIQLATYLSILKRKQTYKEPEQIPVNPKWLDTNSMHLLQTGIDVKGFLQSREDTNDYSASAICFAKMFEQEINYSFVHWVRKQYSIDLPDYYNKFQPGVVAEVKPNFQSGNQGYPVNFNNGNRRTGKWIPPELGKSKTIARYNLSMEQWESIGINNSSDFLSYWDKIHHVRNRAAHTEKVTLAEANEIQEAIYRLSQNNTLERLSILKKSYQSILA